MRYPAGEVEVVLTISRVPMICPFIGGTFGGFLYDAIIFTGESPINTPYMGLKRIFRPSKKGVKEAVVGKPEV